jgi:hypothetical protein
MEAGVEDQRTLFVKFAGVALFEESGDWFDRERYSVGGF